MTAAEPHDQTRRIHDATHGAGNAHDAGAGASIFAADAVLREAGSGMEPRGRAAIRERAALLPAARLGIV